MQAISIYGGNPALRKQAEAIIWKMTKALLEDLSAECYDNFDGFLTSAVMNPSCILFMAQEGIGSAELALHVRERLPEQCFIWFSDMDFAMISQQMGVDFFGILPLNVKKLRVALRKGMRHARRRTSAQTENDVTPVADSRPCAILGETMKPIQPSNFF